MRVKTYPFTSMGCKRALKDIRKEQSQRNGLFYSAGFITVLFVGGVVSTGIIIKYIACNVVNISIKSII